MNGQTSPHTLAHQNTHTNAHDQHNNGRRQQDQGRSSPSPRSSSSTNSHPLRPTSAPPDFDNAQAHNLPTQAHTYNFNHNVSPQALYAGYSVHDERWDGMQPSRSQSSQSDAYTTAAMSRTTPSPPINVPPTIAVLMKQLGLNPESPADFQSYLQLSSQLQSVPPPQNAGATSPSNAAMNGLPFIPMANGQNACKYFVSGHCARGDRCVYAHIMPPKSVIASAFNGQMPQQMAPQQMNAFQPNERGNNGQRHRYQNNDRRNNGGQFDRHDRHGGNHNNNGHNQQQRYSHYGNGNNNNSNNNNRGSRRYDDDNRRRQHHDERGDRNGPMYTLDPLTMMPTVHMQHHAHDNDGAMPLTIPGVPPHVINALNGLSPTDDLQGHIYAIAKDQYGCRWLQRAIEEGTVNGIIDLTFAECYEHMNDLMTDPFGNYLCQKLIEACNENQRLAIITKVSDDLVPISLNMHGTRAVQKLVETVITVPELETLINALRSSVVTLIKDLNGNHVIQRCLHHLSAMNNQFIYDAITRHCVSVATHKHGCCVIQRCIDYATIQQKRQLVNEIINNTLELVQDAFGNYVVQYILDLGDPAVIAGVMGSLSGSISSLSVQKFSSNVVEKCLELGNDKLRASMIDELMHAERLPRLLQDPYANYVIQKALSVCRKHQFEQLVTVIKPHLVALRNTSFGKRIQNKIMKKFPDLQSKADWEESGLSASMNGMSLGGNNGMMNGDKRYAEPNGQSTMAQLSQIIQRQQMQMQQQQQFQQQQQQQYGSQLQASQQQQPTQNQQQQQSQPPAPVGPSLLAHSSSSDLLHHQLPSDLFASPQTSALPYNTSSSLYSIPATSLTPTNEYDSTDDGRVIYDQFRHISPHSHMSSLSSPSSASSRSLFPSSAGSRPLPIGSANIATGNSVAAAFNGTGGDWPNSSLLLNMNNRAVGIPL